MAKVQNNKMKSCRTLEDAVMVLQNAKTHGYHEDEYPEEASDAGDEYPHDDLMQHVRDLGA